MRRVIIARVLDDSLAHFERQIQSAEGSVSLLKVLDDSQRVQVVVKEKSVPSHRRIQRLLPGMAEWRMADVMHECESFH